MYSYFGFSVCITFVLGVCAFLSGSVFGQISFTDLPEWEVNSRFASPAISEVKHPSLSLNEFDCDSNCGPTHGLKQVLEQVSVPNLDPAIKEVYDEKSIYII